MRTKLSRLLSIPMVALTLLGGAAVHVDAQTSTTTVSPGPNGGRIVTTIVTYPDGTIIRTDTYIPAQQQKQVQPNQI